MKKSSLIVSGLTLLLIACGEPEKKRTGEVVYSTEVNMEDEMFTEKSKKQGSAHSGENYSSIDATVQYGAGFSKKVNDTLNGYNLELIVSSWIREEQLPCEGAIAVSLNKKNGEVKVWKNVKPIENNFKEKNWNFIVDTFRFKGEEMKDVAEIKVFAMKVNGSDVFDVDDLNIKYIYYK